MLVVLYFGISYANYMLKPTSETFSERSAEWVRDDVPFGNWIIDTAEHYTASTPRKGGPGLKRLPSVGLSPVRPPVKHAKHGHLHAATDQTGVRQTAARRRRMAPHGSLGRWPARRCS